ncbi:hypothetical protein O181_091222 [Austropuccinia psidii MF-1]|uniref:Uncharacterized protein n=1 Tax=Austropuccinia psidii MF-1 TaxID=1389203 RepID=A0A9Q3IX37_9BASI|nr:hypothetical protein [Austropuccinia psidii MF-1]
MPVQHSAPERQTRSQAVLTPTPRAPLDGTPEVPQLQTQLERGTIWEGAAESRKERRRPRRSSPGEDGEQGEDSSVEEEGSDGTEGVPSPVGESQGTGGPTLAQSHQPVYHHYELSLLATMQQMNKIMANL